MLKSLKGEEVFRAHFFIWKILGFIIPKNYRVIYIIFSVAMNIFVTILYPMHLMIGLINSETKYDAFQNLPINLTCLVCSIKLIIIGWKLDKVRKIVNIINKLDKRIDGSDERKYYETTMYAAVRGVFYLLVFIGVSAILTSEGAIVIVGVFGEWRLMYPAYFPFNAYASHQSYFAAHFYQIFGVSWQIVQNICNDTFAPICLVLIGGHVHLLRLRVAKIGSDPKKTNIQNNAELLECIEDHKHLLELRIIIEDVVSINLLLQIILTSISICLTIIFIIFYVESIFAYIYYVVFLFAMGIEIFPCCYYGTNMEIEFENLTYAIFSCNWVEQDVCFRKNLRIFAEQSLKKRNCLAGRMFYVNLNTFFATCKGAYSLFAVVAQMK